MSILSAFLELLMALLLLRLLIRPAQAYFHPLYGLLYRVTDPLLLPSRYLTRTAVQGILLTVAALAVIRGGLYSVSPSVGLAAGVGQSLVDLIELVFQAYMVFWVVAVLGGGSYGAPFGQMLARAFLPLDAILGKLGMGRAKILPGSFFLLLVLYVLSSTAVRALLMIQDVPSVGLILAALAEGLLLFIGLFPLPGFFSLVLIVGALLSWVSPDPRNPVVQAIYGISEPLLAPFRRFVPTLGGIDLSPMVALLAFQFLGAAAQRLVLELFRMASAG